MICSFGRVVCDAFVVCALSLPSCETMDLMLNNFVFDEFPMINQTSPVHAHAEEKKRVVSGKREFYVSFNQLQPVKAIVARKRPKKTVSTINVQRKTKSQTEFQSNQANTLVKKCSKERSMNLTENAVQTTFPIHHKPKISTLLQKDHHVIGQPTVCPFNEKLFSEQRLESLDIHPHSKKNIADLLNYTRLTMVQSMAIPKLLMGNDALIRSQTGSGKTLAYALPLIERLHAIRPKICRTNGILAVVIVPTRELAVQTYELFLKLLKPFSWVVPGYLTGGEKRKTEKGRLRAGLNIIIGTPGRLCDHIRNTESLKFLNVHWLVLDEADRMLELGYEKDIKEIIDAIRTGKKVDSAGNFHTLQTVLLSATLTTSVKELAGLTLHDPVCIETSEIIHDKIPSFEDGIQHFGELLNMNEYVSLPATVKQRYMIIPPKLRLVVLSGLIAFEQRQKPSKILVFMATQDLIDFHYNIMVEILTIQKRHAANEHVKNDSHEEDDLCHVSGMENNKECNILLPNVKFFKLHGRMTQIERTSVFQTFRKTKAAVLLCTDVAARGIDVPLVDLVVQYHAPHMLADYVHRVGRTARAGESGKAILFMEPAEVEFIQYLSSKHIRIEEQKSKGIFMHLGQLLKTYHKRNIMNTEQCSFELQHRYEQLVSKEKELFNGASKAFVSWVRYYSNFPKDLRTMFSIKAIHMGHYAKSLGLREAPREFMYLHTDSKQTKSSAVANHVVESRKEKNKNKLKLAGKNEKTRPINRGEYHTNKMKRFASNNLIDFIKSSRLLNTSEFDSGFGWARKK